MHWAALPSEALSKERVGPLCGGHGKKMKELPQQVKPCCCHMPGHRPLGMHKAGLSYPVWCLNAHNVLQCACQGLREPI